MAMISSSILHPPLHILSPDSPIPAQPQSFWVWAGFWVIHVQLNTNNVSVGPFQRSCSDVSDLPHHKLHSDRTGVFGGGQVASFSISSNVNPGSTMCEFFTFNPRATSALNTCRVFKDARIIVGESGSDGRMCSQTLALWVGRLGQPSVYEDLGTKLSHQLSDIFHFQDFR